MPDTKRERPDEEPEAASTPGHDAPAALRNRPMADTPRASSPFEPEGRPTAEAAARGEDAGAPPDPAGSNRAPDLTREYATDRISVLWYAGRCVHAAACIRSLPAAFDPRRRPWVDVQAADADEIAAAVLRCPTGALHFIRHDGGPQEVPEAPTRATPVRNGPLVVRGDLEVVGPGGEVIRRDTRIAFCRCGRSGHMPFCDNTHRASGWREPEQAEDSAWGTARNPAGGSAPMTEVKPAPGTAGTPAVRLGADPAKDPDATRAETSGPRGD